LICFSSPAHEVWSNAHIATVSVNNFCNERKQHWLSSVIILRQCVCWSTRKSKAERSSQVESYPEQKKLLQLKLPNTIFCVPEVRKRSTGVKVVCAVRKHGIVRDIRMKRSSDFVNHTFRLLIKRASRKRVWQFMIWNYISQWKLILRRRISIDLRNDSLGIFMPFMTLNFNSRVQNMSRR
jgi:hypothetical protein